MGKKFDLKSYLVKLEDMKKNKEELDKLAWKCNVIDTHIQTSLEARRVLDESRTWRIRLEQSWDEIREVTKAWSKYEDQFQKAIHNLSKRIENFERDLEEKKDDENISRKETTISWSRNHFAKCTILSEWRKRKKYVPETTVHMFRIL